MSAMACEYCPLLQCDSLVVWPRTAWSLRGEGLVPLIYKDFTNRTQSLPVLLMLRISTFALERNDSNCTGHDCNDRGGCP